MRKPRHGGASLHSEGEVCGGVEGRGDKDGDKRIIRDSTDFPHARNPIFPTERHTAYVVEWRTDLAAIL